MAIPVAAAVTAGAGLVSNIVGGLFGAKTSNKINKRNIAFAREMWDKQVAYADRQQRHIEDYNDPAAQRERLEAAGYNPYLVDGNEIGAVSSPSPTSAAQSDYGPLVSNSISGAVRSFADIYNSMTSSNQTQAQTAGQVISNQGAAYNLQKQIDNDNVSHNGVRSYFSTGRMSIFQADGLEAQANLTSAQAATQKLLADYNAAPAVDYAGQPMIDEDGTQINNLTARERGTTLSIYKTLDKVNAEIINAGKSGKLLDVDYLIKQFDLENTMPQMLENLRITAAKLNSEIMVNRAQKEALLSSAYATRQQGLTTEYLRPHVLGKAFNDATNSEYEALSNGLSYQYQKRYAPIEFENFKTSTSTKRGAWGYFDAGIGTFGQILGGAANGAAAWRGFKGR